MPIHTEISGPVAWLTIDDPPTRNAISRATAEQLHGAFLNAQQDPNVRVAVLSGAGERAFASGADVTEFARYAQNLDEMAAYDQAVTKVYDTITRSRLPVIAAVQAAAIGGGGLLALACDIRIAADTAVFALPAARIGLMLSDREYLLAHDRLGNSAASYLLLSGQRVDAAEALRLGAFHRVVPAADFDQKVRATASAVAELAPLSLQASKSILRSLQEGAGLDKATFEAAYRAVYGSADFREGIAAFIEKRRPKFSGL